MSRLASIPPDPTRDDPEDAKLPMRDWWQGCYSHVYVALHPFQAAPEDPDDPAFDAHADAKAAAPIRWRTLADSVGETRFETFALATLLAGYGMTSKNRRGMKPAPDDRLIAALHAHCDREQIAFPWDDSPSPALEMALGAAFSRLGSASVTGWSEFRDEHADIAVADLADPAMPCAGRLPRGIYAYRDPQCQLLATASFDHIWTTLAMTDTARELVRPEDHFEGFWAGPETTMNWINEPGTYQPPEGWT